MWKPLFKLLTFKLRILHEILVFGTFFSVLFFLLVLFGIQIYGKPFLLERVQAFFPEEVSIGSTHYVFPFGVKAVRFSIGQTFQAESVTAQFNVRSLRDREIHLLQLVLEKPFFNIDRIETSESSPLRIRENPGPGAGRAATPKLNSLFDQNWRYQVDQLVIENGRFYYTDETYGRVMTLSFYDVELIAEPLNFPFLDIDSRFRVKATLANEDSPLAGCVIDGAGSLNLDEFNMDARFKVISPNNRIALTARTLSKNNDMRVTGQLDVRQFNLTTPYNQRIHAGSTPFDKLIIGALSTIGLNLVADYEFDTKMNNFSIEKVRFEGRMGTSTLESSTNAP